MKLKTERMYFYLVKRGDTLQSIAKGAQVSPVALCKLNGIPMENGLKIGMILAMPPSGDRYTVQIGDNVTNLCGSEERYEELNGEGSIYPGKEIRI